MALKFQCESCGGDIAVRFLEIGEAAKCRSCGASNSVPESAESISDEAAKSISKASVSQSAESISDGTPEDETLENEPIAKALRVIGKISLGLGVIMGTAALVGIILPAPSLASVFGGIVAAFSVTLFYCTAGVLCLGVSRIIDLLRK